MFLCATSSRFNVIFIEHKAGCVFLAVGDIMKGGYTLIILASVRIIFVMNICYFFSISLVRNQMIESVKEKEKKEEKNSTIKLNNAIKNFNEISKWFLL